MAPFFSFDGPPPGRAGIGIGPFRRPFFFPLAHVCREIFGVIPPLSTFVELRRRAYLTPPPPPRGGGGGGGGGGDDVGMNEDYFDEHLTVREIPKTAIPPLPSTPAAAPDASFGRSTPKRRAAGGASRDIPLAVAIFAMAVIPRATARTLFSWRRFAVGGGGGGIRRELFPSVVASFPFLKFISISREYMFDFSFSLPPLSLSRSLLSSSPRR